MIIKGKVKNLWAGYNGMLLPVHTDAEKQVAEIEINIDVAKIIRDFKIALDGKRYKNDFPDKLAQEISERLIIPFS